MPGQETTSRTTPRLMPRRAPKASGPMLDDLQAALGGFAALQAAISERVLSSPPGRLRMDVVAELWREHCQAA